MNYRVLCVIIILFMNASTVLSQNDTSIEHYFKAYNSGNYQEKVFLHTDKTVYASGEILWFKAYIINANSNSLSSLSSICYVEVISADKKPLLQGKINIDSSTGNGSFMIPSSIRSGNYIIRAYTNWMKNFDPSFYFEQPISIINPNKKPETIIRDTNVSYFVQFFPEGGNLVYGLNNTVAFKITNIYGKGVQGKGTIFNEKNESIVSFESQHFGIGTFPFNPVKGNKYHAILQINNKDFHYNLPEIYNNGWTLHVKDEGNTLLVTAACNMENEHNVFLFAQTRDSIKFAKSQPIINGLTIFVINKADIGEGISQLTVFNEKKQPVCERLYFKKLTHLLQVKLNGKQDYQVREKVNINLSTDDVNGIASSADMSVAVYLIDSLQPGQEINLLNYLWLSSDLKGKIESPQYYFENSGAEVDKATDDLMLTHGWRRFKWEDVLKNNAPSFTFLPEREGHIITGKLLPKISGVPVNGINANLSVPGKIFKFSNSTSSSLGDVKFNVEKFYGSHEIIAQTNSADSNYHIFIDNPFSTQYAESIIQPFNFKSNQSDKFLIRTVGAEAQNNFQPEKKQNFILPSLFDTTAFFGKPSKTYNLDNYTRFPTMEEVMREYVKEVRVKNRQKSFHYQVWNEPAKVDFKDDPLVLIDGVSVSDINKIIEVDPLKIKKVDIVTNAFFLGQQEYNGIVSYSTYNDDLEGYQLDPNSLVIEYEGLQFEREFYSPQYENASEVQSRIPDYRNVLYWSPHIKAINGKKDISFYTSDIPGKYIVFVQGITRTSGLAGFGSTTINVAHGLK